MLYQFSSLNIKLDQLGFPKLSTGSGFQLIKGINFEKAFKADKISFDNDNINLLYQDKSYKGYMFIDYYYVNYNNQPAKYPKFHLVKCKTIQNFIDSGQFDQRYIWSNADKNDITDVQSGVVHKDIVLKLCQYCSNKLSEGFHDNNIDDTNDFHNTLDKSEIKSEVIEVDIFGYVKGKEKISKAYRRSKNYQCESCGVKCKEVMHRRWWHTHHINGDKTHNDESNLECLCVLCHSNKDSRHQNNFANNRMQIELNHFIDKYNTELVKVQNPYI